MVKNIKSCRFPDSVNCNFTYRYTTKNKKIMSCSIDEYSNYYWTMLLLPKTLMSFDEKKFKTTVFKTFKVR